jgi:hypothetical protein
MSFVQSDKRNAMEMGSSSNGFQFEWIPVEWVPFQMGSISNVFQFKWVPVRMCSSSNVFQFECVPVRMGYSTNGFRFECVPVRMASSSNVFQFKWVPVQMCSSSYRKLKSFPVHTTNVKVILNNKPNSQSKVVYRLIALLIVTYRF